MKKVVFAFILALLMLLSVFPSSFAEEAILDEVILKNEAVEDAGSSVEEKEGSLTLSASPSVSLSKAKANECRHEVTAADLDESGAKTSDDGLFIVSGIPDNGAWRLSSTENMSLTIKTESGCKIKRVFLYFREELDRETVEQYFAAELPDNLTMSAYSAAKHCLTLTGEFNAETSLTSAESVSVTKLVICSEHLDTDENGSCDVCGYSTSARSRTFDMSKAAEALKKHSEWRNFRVHEQFDGVFKTLQNSFSKLIRPSF